MGKLLDSILSGSSGKVGRVVVANLYGNEILRTRSRRRKAEPTAKQLLVQLRMKKAMISFSRTKNLPSSGLGKG